MLPQGQHDPASTAGTSSTSPKVVLHIDLDAFFVQVERSLNPTLIGARYRMYAYSSAYCLFEVVNWVCIRSAPWLLLLSVFPQGKKYFRTTADLKRTNSTPLT